MSIWASAFISHQWTNFNLQSIDQIAETISSNAGEAKWRLVSESGSSEVDYAKYGEVTFHLSSGFQLKYAKRFFELTNQNRWSALLVYKNVRNDFLSVCSRVAHVSGGKEILLLPEGTILEDSLYDDIDFQEVKNRANHLWGPPDLEINRFYTETEINEMPRDERVRYFIVPIS